jgi:hypothetical protein
MRQKIVSVNQTRNQMFCLSFSFVEKMYVSTMVYPKVSGLSQQRNKQQQQQTLVEKQHKGLWRQNSLELLTK